MDCNEASAKLLDRRRNKLDARVAAELDAHLETCEACRAEDAKDAALTAALDKLPRRRASAALKRSLETRWVARPRLARTGGMLAAAGVGAALAAAAFFLYFGWHGRGSSDAIFAEAVNDHLRVLYAEHPVEVQSGGVHQVKPWFAGRLDFAPVLAFGGDDEFPLQGGAVAYFLDRKAAALEFKRRLHAITLFVFRADGLSWPTPSRSIGGQRASIETQRGFHVLLWRRDDLGYALVSDVDERELLTLGAKIAGESHE